MLKVGQFIEELDALLQKQAFVPAPQQSNPMLDQVMQMVQQLPPEVQQQVMPQLQQVQQLPPEQQQPVLEQLAQGLQQMMQQGGAQQQDPNAQQPPAQPAPEQAPAQQDPNASGENNLDNTKVTLTVRELMDLTSGGKATSASLAVKQMMARHEQKMQAEQQKQQQVSQQQASAAQAGPDLQGGGIYPNQ